MINRTFIHSLPYLTELAYGPSFGLVFRTNAKTVSFDTSKIISNVRMFKKDLK